MRKQPTARIGTHMLTRILAVVCLFALATSNPVNAASRTDQRSCEIAAGSPLPAPKLVEKESAVEVEIGASDSVLNLVTTLDGTIRPIWPADQDLSAMPKDIFESLKTAYPDLSPLDAPWGVLTADEQRRLLMAAAPLERETFFANRSVRGLKYKDKITLTFFKRTRFAGRILSAGTHTFNSADIFGKTVIEYMGPERRRERLGFELHIRSRYSAGDNFLTARAFTRALTGGTTALHLHIVAPYPDQKPDTIEGLRMIAAYQKWVILHDLLLMERKGTIDNLATGFYPYNESAVLDLFKGAKSIDSWDQMPSVTSKFGTMGLRTHPSYDELVWGIESRYLSPLISDERLFYMLNFIQDQMLSGELTLRREQALKYSAYFFGKLNPKTAVMRGTDGIDKATKDSFVFWDAYHENAMILYLYRNFRNNVEFYQNKPLLEQIEKAQKDGRALLENGMKPTDVMEIFARKSGLRHYFSQQFPGVLP